MNEVININGVDCYEKDGTAYLKLENVARGLGFTTVATSGNEVVRWNTVHKYLEELGVATSCNGASYRENCPDFIPENIFYRLAMKAKNETAEKFQAKVADEIIPSIRKTGSYGRYTPKLDEMHLKAMELIADCSPEKLPYMMMVLQDVGITFTMNMHTYRRTPDVSPAEKNHITNRKNPVHSSINNHGIDNFLEGISVADKPTNDVYTEYLDYCSKHNIKPVSKIGFSKVVNKLLGTHVIQKKLNGINRKVFRY